MMNGFRVKRIIVILFGISFISLILAGECFSKDLYVSPSGNDNVSYDNNNINNPWASPEKAWYSARPGDTVYFRGGIYTINSTVNTKYKGYNGTAEKPIIFMSYPGEQVIFRATCTPAFKIQKEYNYVYNITCDGQGTFWELGEDVGGSYFKIQNCNGSQALFGGGPNYGWVRFRTHAHYGLVKNCKVQGPGADGNQNTAAVFCFRSRGVKILNNEFYNFPRGIYYKHTCVGYDTGIEIRNNYIHDCGYDGIWTVSQYARIENNLLVNADLTVAAGGGGGGDDGDNHGGDHNLVQHNTIYNAQLILEPCWDGGASGPQENTFKNNLLTRGFNLMEYNTQSHNSIIDYNLYPSNIVVRHGRNSYTLGQWQTYYGQDSRSLAGSPSFVGGANPSSIDDFALATGSIGKGSASDGKDIGADMSQVGIKGEQGNPPGVPRNLRQNSE